MDCIGFNRFGTGRQGRWLVALLFLVFASSRTDALPPTTLRALPPQQRPAPAGQRFLFVVDISATMRETDTANRQALFEMLFTGIDGQMRTGDTFGLWFYNDKLHTGVFPIQTWDEKDPLPVATLATKLLREQQYSGRSRPDVFMPQLQKVINGVRDLNVLVISLGKPALTGTPFDTNIAAVVKRKLSARESAQKPFVTALIARGGTIINGAVIIPGEELRLPERPAPVLAAKSTNSTTITPSTTNTVAQAPKPKGVVHSISTSESRLQGSELLSPNNEPVTRNSGPGKATAKPEVSNAEPVEQTAATLTPQPLSLPVSPTPTEKVLQFTTRSNVVAANVTAALAPNPETPRASTNQTPTIRAVAVAPIASAPSTNTTKTERSSSELAGNKIEPGTRNPEPGTAAAQAVPVTTTIAGLVKALEPEPIAVAAREPAATGPSPATVAVVTHASGPSSALLLTIGIVLLAACLGLLVVVLRRLRPQRQSSFITRSMELR